jgi:hypothetical protein
MAAHINLFDLVPPHRYLETRKIVNSIVIRNRAQVYRSTQHLMGRPRPHVFLDDSDHEELERPRQFDFDLDSYVEYADSRLESGVRADAMRVDNTT